MNIRVVVNDRMQQGYVYYRTEPVGKNFAPGFRPELTPKQMLQLGVFGGKYMTDCRGEFPASWFTRAKLCFRAARSDVELLRRQRVAVAGHMAAQGVDPQAGSARLVPVVLPLLHGPPNRRRSPADSALASDCAVTWRQIRNDCEPGDLECRRRQRQAVLHWAYDSRKL